MSAGLSQAMGAVITAAAWGYGLGIAFVALILLIGSTRGGE